MTERADKPLRLTAKRRRVAPASRRLVLGLSAASAAALSSLMADGRSAAEATAPASAPTMQTTPTTLPPLEIHVVRQRPTWVPVPPRSGAQAAPRATSARPAPQPQPAAAAVAVTPAPVVRAPTVTRAPRSAPPTTASRAS